MNQANELMEQCEAEFTSALTAAQRTQLAELLNLLFTAAT